VRCVGPLWESRIWSACGVKLGNERHVSNPKMGEDVLCGGPSLPAHTRRVALFRPIPSPSTRATTLLRSPAGRMCILLAGAHVAAVRPDVPTAALVLPLHHACGGRTTARMPALASLARCLFDLLEIATPPFHPPL